jgi:hypothetical protein
MGDDVRRCTVITISHPISKNHQRAKSRQASMINQKELRLKVLVLLYLSEIDTRQLYLPMGYSSLFDFCTMHLKYTRATAARRIRSARAAARYPEALDMLVSGEINITTLSIICDILDRDNYINILSEIRNKSTRHVEMLVSRHRPVQIIRDTVRPICIKKRVEIIPEIIGGDSSSSAETNPANPDDEERRNSNKTSSSAETRIILEQYLKLGFSVSPEFMAKYNKIKSLLSSRYPEGINFETLFDILMTEYLEKHDPDKKRERRLNRIRSAKNESKKSPAGGPKRPRERGEKYRGGCAGRGCGERNIKNHDHRSRHIPPRRAGSGLYKRQGPMHIHKREWKTMQCHLGSGDRSCCTLRAGR